MKKQIELKIEKLYEELENCDYNRKGAITMIRNLRNEIAANFDEGSDTFIDLVCLLIDCNDLASELPY